MNRGQIAPVGAMYAGALRLHGAVLGGGAATNGTLPGNGQLKDDASTYPKAANFAASLTYVSSGIYDFVASESVKHILFASGMVVDAGSAPTAALQVTVTIITPSTKTIRVRITTPAGVLTDLGTSDLLVMAMDVANTSSIG